MARYEDYLGNPVDGLDNEIGDAQQQQAARVDPSTPAVDWEDRYRNLEQMNSRQAQTLGEYRKTIDEFITHPTPTPSNVPEEPPAKFSLDDFYEDPDAALAKAVASHPAIQEAQGMKLQLENDRRQQELDSFANRHPDYNEVVPSPEFQNWVAENPTRVDLFQRGDQYDFSAADALFSLYKAEKGLTQVNNAQQIAQAELVSSSGELAPQEPATYSRSEYINKLKRAKQGDMDAEDWIKVHAANYRMALSNKNVRD
jgi:hypothetical protein